VPRESGPEGATDIPHDPGMGGEWLLSVLAALDE